MAEQKTSRLAIAALVLSLLFFIPFVPLIGLILGIVAIVKISNDPNLKGTGLAIAAIVIGFLAFIGGTGLILGFIRGMFSNVTTQLENQIMNEPNPLEPSVDEPITVSRQNIFTTKGQIEVIKVGYYNSGENSVTDTLFIRCKSMADAPFEDIKEQSSHGQTIDPNTKTSIILIFTVPNEFEQNVEYSCQVGFKTLDSSVYKDVNINIV